MKRMRWLALVAVLALIAGACASEGGDETTTTGGEEATTTAAGDTTTSVATFSFGTTTRPIMSDSPKIFARDSMAAATLFSKPE